MNRQKVTALGAALFTMAALVAAGAMLRSSFRLYARGGARVTQRADWARFAVGIAQVGPHSAPLTIVEFTDFQCPYCRMLTRRLASADKRYPGQIRLVFRNFPLNDHPAARAAALAGICAARAGRFKPMHDLLFSLQDSLGILRWSELALRAGIQDTAAFGRCRRSSQAQAQLTRDLSAASQLGVQATPTYLVNQFLITGTLSDSDFNAIIKRQLNSSRGDVTH